MADRPPAVDLSALRDEIVRLLPEECCRRYTAIPIDRAGHVLVIAIAAPANVFALDDIKFMTGFNVEAVAAPAQAISAALDRHYGTQTQNDSSSDNLEAFAAACAADGDEDGLNELSRDTGAAPLVRLTEAIFREAIKMGASDIHFEPYDKELRVRYRIDGLLVERLTCPLRLSQPLTSRIKALARCDLSEKRLPQTGTIDLHYTGRAIRMTVSILPTGSGERIALKILDKETLILDLTRVGFSPLDVERIDRIICQPTGLVLVSGPRGSGLKSTLYALLARLNTRETNILTAENPIDFGFAGISQVQVKEELGYTYAAALSAFLTQDPDVVMLQELRDIEVSKAVVQTAVERCLVLTSVAAEDAAGSLAKLMEWGVQPTLLGAAVRLVIAQRGIRGLCGRCKVAYTPSRVQLEKAGALALVPTEKDGASVSGLTLFKPGGCVECNNRGYRGRLLVYEMMEVSERIREAVVRGASRHEIGKIALEEGMETIVENALRHALEGRTSLEESVKVG